MNRGICHSSHNDIVADEGGLKEDARARISVTIKPIITRNRSLMTFIPSCT